MNLTEHFTVEELSASDTAARKGIDNTVPLDLLPNLRYLSRILEGIRLAIKHPVRVNSGYRCPDLNEAVGGSRGSAHMKALAADIIAPGFGSPLELCKAVAVLDDVPYDQIIYEFGAWCHVGLVQAGDTPRKQLLTINSRTNGYRKGLLDI